MFQRINATTAPISSEKLYRSIEKRSNSSEDLAKEVIKLSKLAEKLTIQQSASNSLKNKLVDMALGGFIGFFVTVIITFLLSIIF